MDPAMEEYYIQLALNSPNMLCSEVSVEILEAATYDDVEPSQFFRDFWKPDTPSGSYRNTGRCLRERNKSGMPSSCCG